VRSSRRVGGARTWATAAQAEDHQREALKQKRGGSHGRTQSVVPEFRDENDRYLWELARWRAGSFIRVGFCSASGWMGSDERVYVGHPVHPGAPVFEDPDCFKAFKAANAAGYIGCTQVANAAPFRITKYEVRKVIQSNLDKLNVGFVRYPHKMNRSKVWVCTFLHEDEVADFLASFREYAAASIKKMSAGLVPFKQDLMRNFREIK